MVLSPTGSKHLVSVAISVGLSPASADLPTRFEIEIQDHNHWQISGAREGFSIRRAVSGVEEVAHWVGSGFAAEE